MRIYSDTVLKVLHGAGWSEGRDVFDQLHFANKKKQFLAAKEIYSSLGLLKLNYFGKGGEQIIYFDVDDSEISKNMRAEMHGCESWLDPSLKNAPDFEPVENFEWVSKVENHVGQSCAHVGVLEDQIGYDIYVAENGYIYAAHGDEPSLVAINIAHFLNAHILSS